MPLRPIEVGSPDSSLDKSVVDEEILIPDCGTVVFDVDSGFFSRPDFAPRTATRTISSLRKSKEGSDAILASSVQVSAHKNTSKVAHLIDVGTSGSDEVTIHIVVVYSKAFERSRIVATILKNYQPLNAEYVRWNDDRTEILETKISTGLSEELLGNAVALDIIVPRKELDGINELELFFEFNERGSASSYYGHSRRYITIGGGDDVEKTLGPFKCASGEPRTEQERETSKYAFLDNYLFPNNVYDIEEINTPIQSTSPVEISLTTVPTENGKKQGVSILLLDGKPTPHVWFVEDPIDTRPFVKFRDKISLNIPNGEHSLVVPTWFDPYKIGEDINGEKIGNIWFSGVGQTTNFLHFQIK